MKSTKSLSSWKEYLWLALFCVAANFTLPSFEIAFSLNFSTCSGVNQIRIDFFENVRLEAVLQTRPIPSLHHFSCCHLLEEGLAPCPRVVLRIYYELADAWLPVDQLALFVPNDLCSPSRSRRSQGSSWWHKNAVGGSPTSVPQPLFWPPSLLPFIDSQDLSSKMPFDSISFQMRTPLRPPQ